MVANEMLECPADHQMVLLHSSEACTPRPSRWEELERAYCTVQVLCSLRFGLQHLEGIQAQNDDFDQTG